MIVRPEQLEAMEVYTSTIGVPPEFTRGFTPCGVVAVWTQPQRPRPARTREVRRAIS